jgi:hypothetical protein
LGIFGSGNAVSSEGGKDISFRDCLSLQTDTEASMKIKSRRMKFSMHDYKCIRGHRITKLSFILQVSQVKILFCLMKHHAMKTYGGVEVRIHAVLTSVLEVIIVTKEEQHSSLSKDI